MKRIEERRKMKRISTCRSELREEVEETTFLPGIPDRIFFLVRITPNQSPSVYVILSIATSPPPA